MELITVGVILGLTLVFFIGTQMAGICCKQSSYKKRKTKRRFKGTSSIIYGSI